MFTYRRASDKKFPKVLVMMVDSRRDRWLGAARAVQPSVRQLKHASHPQHLYVNKLTTYLLGSVISISFPATSNHSSWQTDETPLFVDPHDDFGVKVL